MTRPAKRVPQPAEERWVIGVDPGIENTGLFLLSVKGTRFEHMESRHVQTKSTLGVQERVAAVYYALMELLGITRLLLSHTVVVFERQESVIIGKQRAGFTNASSLETLQVVGAIRAVALQNGVELFELEPRTAKVAVCGRGGSKAEKKTVERALRAIVHGCPPKMNEHISDAGAAAVGGSRLALRAQALGRR